MYLVIKSDLLHIHVEKLQNGSENNQLVFDAPPRSTCPRSPRHRVETSHLVSHTTLSLSPQTSPACFLLHSSRWTSDASSAL